MTGRIQSGLCSVTFRDRRPDDIVALAAGAGIDAVEWAGDVHLPAGDQSRAEALRRLCGDAGLTTPSYGSYVTARTDPEDVVHHGTGAVHEIGAALDTAEALGARTVRVWAGTRGSASTDPDGRARVVGQLRAWTEQATARGLCLGVEYHAGTLTDTADSAVDLLEEVDQPGFGSYWQPRDRADHTGTADDATDRDPLDRDAHDAGAHDRDAHDGGVHHRDPHDRADLAELGRIAATGRLLHLHVFSWHTWFDRHPLDRRSGLWPAAFEVAEEAEAPVPRVAFLEFVRGDDPDQFRIDARQLRTWLRSA